MDVEFTFLSFVGLVTTLLFSTFSLYFILKAIYSISVFFYNLSDDMIKLLTRVSCLEINSSSHANLIRNLKERVDELERESVNENERKNEREQRE